MSLKKELVKETANEKIINVEAASIDEFYDEEIQERIEELDKYGPFGDEQQIPFVTKKELAPIGIILAICYIAHLWAWFTIGN